MSAPDRSCEGITSSGRRPNIGYTGTGCDYPLAVCLLNLTDATGERQNLGLHSASGS